MRLLVLTLMSLMLANPSFAQTTQVDPKAFQWGNAFQEGMEHAKQRQMAEAESRAAIQQAEANRALLEEQRKSLELDNERQRLELEKARAEQQDAPQLDSHTVDAMRRWSANAAPRRGLYADFDEVVFNKDVAITIDMIELMADSRYAADIAYYLGSHKLRSYEIAAMPRLQQATALAEIEQLAESGGAAK